MQGSWVRGVGRQLISVAYRGKLISGEPYETINSLEMPKHEIAYIYR